jgi:hypothetical protein
MASYGMAYMPSVTKIGAGVPAILRFNLSNFRSYNIGITDVGDL